MAMASLAHLSREERIGLGVAAAAHIALLLALMFDAWDDRQALPMPERMEVSLASEVSLESTAPDPTAEPQAAVAPVLAPEPEPAVAQPEPVVRERTRPEPQPTARERPTPRPTRTPEPRETQRATGSRIGSDFLEGTAGTERSEDRGNPATTFGAAERASLQAAINRELRPEWNAPSGVDAEKLVTVLTWELNPDGSLKGAPNLVRQSGINDSNRPQAALHAERAMRAVRVAAPFDLPEELYSHWRRLTWTFDRNLSR